MGFFAVLVLALSALAAILWQVQTRLLPRPEINEHQLTRNANDNPVIRPVGMIDTFLR
jgi:hypothetical protein